MADREPLIQMAEDFGGPIIVGYTRPLFLGEDLAIEVRTLEDAGVRTVIEETSSTSRTHLAAWLDQVIPGDTIVVTHMERLGGQITRVGILIALRERSVVVRCLDG